jgi:hypothetical protein
MLAEQPLINEYQDNPSEVQCPSDTNGNQVEVKRDWPNWDSPTKNWTKSSQDLSGRARGGNASQHTESSSRGALTPMQRWEEEKQQDSPYNAVARYGKIARVVRESRTVDEEIEDDMHSTSATLGDSASTSAGRKS